MNVEAAGRTEHLSVVIAAYNAAEDIAKAVRSAFDAHATEVLVVDDGSTDDTFARAEAAGATCVRQSNTGAASARRLGVTKITGDLLIFLDADDELLPAGVAKSVGMLRSDIGLVVCAGTIVGRGPSRTVRFPVRYQPVDTTSLLRNGYGPWPPAAAVIRTSALIESREATPEPLDPRFAEDFEMLIRLSMQGRIDVHDVPAALYSLAGGKSATSAGTAVQTKEEIRAYYSEFCGISVELLSEREIKRAALIRVARAHWASGRRAAALAMIAKWFLTDPLPSVKKLMTKPWKRN